MQEYLVTLNAVYDGGILYPDRTGTGRRRLFGGDCNTGMETYDLALGLPLVTTRQIFTKGMIKELFGFIRGKTDVESLGKSFWGRWVVTDEDIKKYAQTHLDRMLAGATEIDPKDVSEEQKQKFLDVVFEQHKNVIGTIGPMYGKMWRSFPRVSMRLPWWLESYDDVPSDVRENYRAEFLTEVVMSNGNIVNDKETWEKYCFNRYNAEGYDQLAMVMKSLKVRPYSSRHRVTAFHPDLVGSEDNSPQENVIEGYGALAPCHQSFQFMVTDDADGNKVLNCMLYMSSSDVPIGRPYNICQYSMLTMMMAHCLDYKPGLFTIVSCDTHIYANQMHKVPLQLGRTPHTPPKFVINPEKKDLFSLTPDDVQIVDYVFHEKIDYEVSK